MKVRINKTPAEAEIDGITLSALRPGVIRDVPSSLGAWLIAKGYAQHEMRGESRRAANAMAEQSPSRDHHRRALEDRRRRRW